MRAFFAGDVGRMTWRLWFLCAVSCLVACVPNDEVQTSYGKLQGITDQQVRQFLGVPYAAPPTGDNRWRAPQPLPPWDGVRQATGSALGCMQGTLPTGVFFDREDCLYLDIWAPEGEGPFPVMVWFHGGGLALGSGTEWAYHGAKLAHEQQVVVVNINYRLSIWGFLALPQLSAESGYGSSGNYGFLDQHAALQWINQEIAAFGGDNNNITLFGESAGGLSICMHMASPLSRGLFHKAITQSAPCDSWTTKTLAEAEAYGLEVAARMGCSDANTALQCLQAMSENELKAGLNIPDNEIFAVPFDDWGFFPALTLDNYFMPQDALDLVSANPWPIPVMMGLNRDEGSFFEAFYDHAPDEVGYLAQLQDRYGDDAMAIAQQYPWADYVTTGDAMAAIRREQLISCSTRLWADQLSDLGYPMFQYHFIQDVNSLTKWLNTLPLDENDPDIGVHHVAEVAYVFGEASVIGDFNTDSRRYTRDAMMRYWANFARTGDPNLQAVGEQSGLPAWPGYRRNQPDYLNLGGDFRADSDLYGDACRFWQALEG